MVADQEVTAKKEQSIPLNKTLLNSLIEEGFDLLELYEQFIMDEDYESAKQVAETIENLRLSYLENS